MSLLYLATSENHYGSLPLLIMETYMLKTQVIVCPQLSCRKEERLQKATFLLYIAITIVGRMVKETLDKKSGHYQEILLISSD